MPVDTSQVRRYFSGLISAAARVEGDLKTIAHRRARAVQAAAKARVPKDTHLTEHSIVVLDESAQRQFVVTVQDMTGRMPMLPVWLEFGTRSMGARPFLGPSLFESRDPYVKEAEALIAQVAAEAEQ